MMYADRYYYNQLASWGFSLHGMQKLNVEAIQAQTSKIPLVLRFDVHNLLDAYNAYIDLDNRENQIRSLFSTVHPNVWSLRQQTAKLQATTLSMTLMPFWFPIFRVSKQFFRFITNTTILGKRTILISAVDSNLRRLLNSWLLVARVQEPNIVKVFEIEIPLAQQSAILKVTSILNAYIIRV
jgi:hypothetical protein